MCCWGLYRRVRSVVSELHSLFDVSASSLEDELSEPTKGTTVHEYDDLLTAILTALEAEGVDPDSYCLYDFVETGALEKLMDAGDDSITVSFSVRGFPVVVTPNRVSATAREPLEQI